MFGGLLTGCVSPRPHVAAPSAGPHTQLLLLNTIEASGWVAYAPAGHQDEDATEYRIQVTRANDGRVVYDSTLLLCTNLATHAFELSPDDPLLASTHQTVDQTILATLDLSDGPSSFNDVPPPPLSLSITGREAETLRLAFEKGQQLQVGEQLFLRSPEVVRKDPITGDEIRTGNRIAALLEVTQVHEGTAEATLISGRLLENATLERAGTGE